MDYDTHMELYRKLYDASAVAAERVKIDKIYIGISYTAVTTSDGDAVLLLRFE